MSFLSWICRTFCIDLASVWMTSEMFRLASVILFTFDELHPIFNMLFVLVYLILAFHLILKAYSAWIRDHGRLVILKTWRIRHLSMIEKRPSKPNGLFEQILLGKWLFVRMIQRYPRLPGIRFSEFGVNVLFSRNDSTVRYCQESLSRPPFFFLGASVSTVLPVGWGSAVEFGAAREFRDCIRGQYWIWWRDRRLP
jgi:hypothetical protein